MSGDVPGVSVVFKVVAVGEECVESEEVETLSRWEKLEKESTGTVGLCASSYRSARVLVSFRAGASEPLSISSMNRDCVPAGSRGRYVGTWPILDGEAICTGISQVPLGG